MEKDFSLFMSQLVETNNTLDFFTDFKKVSKHVQDITISLNELNSLIGASDLKVAVNLLWNRDPKAFEVLNLLIAVRKAKQTKVLSSKGGFIPLKNYFEDPSKILQFLEETGLSDVFESKKITNLVDYVFGIEVGLDSNARKNRSGELMESVVASIFKEQGIQFRKEIYSKEWDAFSQSLGNDLKRFDFITERKGITYLIEVNFYNSGGSKLNEVARSFTELATKINAMPDFEFVWITDGLAWQTARNKLEEAYNQIPRVYNLTTIYNFIDFLKS